MIRFLQNPKSGQRALIGLIVVIVVISMVGYLGSYFTDAGASTTQGVFASVGGEQITTQEVSDAANRQARDRFPNGVPEMFRPYLNQQAADRLLTRAALVAEARRMGLKATDEEVRSYLQQGELGRVLFPGGKFIGKEAYDNWVLANTGVSTVKFEQDIKESLLIQKLIAVVQGGVAVPDSEVQRQFQRENVKVKFDYAVLTVEDLMKKVPMTEAELKGYFERNKANFETQIPEQRKARYVIIDPAAIQVTITDEDYKRAYGQRQEEFRQPEQVDVRHILVKTEAEALDVKKKLEAGAKFDDLAKKVSEDPGSKDNGGLYKGVVKGQMVPEFEKVAFSLPKGKISDPVKTSFGYHILRVDEHRDAQLKPLAEVKGQLEAALRTEKAGAQMEELADKIESEAKSAGLEKAAAKHGLKVINTEYFNQSASLPGAGNSPQFMQELFTLKANSAPTRLPLAQGYAVAEVLDVKPASKLTPTFEEARARVEQQYRSERAASMLPAKTQELADRAHALNNLKAAAKEFGAAVKSSDLVSPSAQVADLGSMSGPASRAFEMKPGQISDAIIAGRNGAVISVTQLQEPSPAEFEAKREDVRQALMQQKRISFLEAYADSIRSRMQKDGDIKINVNEQKRLLGPLAGS